MRTADKAERAIARCNAQTVAVENLRERLADAERKKRELYAKAWDVLPDGYGISFDHAQRGKPTMRLVAIESEAS